MPAIVLMPATASAAASAAARSASNVPGCDSASPLSIQIGRLRGKAFGFRQAAIRILRHGARHRDATLGQSCKACRRKIGARHMRLTLAKKTAQRDGGRFVAVDAFKFAVAHIDADAFAARNLRIGAARAGFQAVFQERVERVGRRGGGLSHGALDGRGRAFAQPVRRSGRRAIEQQRTGQQHRQKSQDHAELARWQGRLRQAERVQHPAERKACPQRMHGRRRGAERGQHKQRNHHRRRVFGRIAMAAHAPLKNFIAAGAERDPGRLTAQHDPETEIDQKQKIEGDIKARRLKRCHHVLRKMQKSAVHVPLRSKATAKREQRKSKASALNVAAGIRQAVIDVIADIHQRNDQAADQTGRNPAPDGEDHKVCDL